MPQIMPSPVSTLIRQETPSASDFLSSVLRWIEEDSLTVACQQASARLATGLDIQDEDRDALMLLLNAAATTLSAPRRTADQAEWTFDDRAFQAFADMVDILRIQDQQISEVMAIANEVV
ncbi:hypothetical protein [Azospirillum brasilense]|uniref:hypothetical protein n=1 Tax=Azospirillum brasilense TaxID=192 RepID=UPI001EDA1107|nr:hypothetical protein [Azospirillum brasilense]UKJ78162.1 hypothetical protein H1Q64_32730 [Azospirillum brasilense]